jgi:GNAT superfamily N-acetyltransferase
MPSVHHRGRAAAHRSGEATFLVAWHERRPVGHLLLKWDGSDAESVRRRLGRMPELNAIIVIPPLRSRGIGSRLIAAAERLVAARGIGCAGLAVGVENRRARALYERLGYRDWAEGTFELSWEAPDAPGGREHETCVYLLKRISGAERR